MILNERRLLALACVFFLLVKSLWVLLPVQAMGLPRLGDDGLVYLWTGAGTVLNPQVDTPAVQDIVALRQLKDGGDDALDFLRARTTMRVTYVAASPFAMLTGLLVHSGLSHKAAFAGAELIVAIVLAAGIASLGAALFGALGAAVALVVLAFAILPLQGIHYLIPGVLALALALLQLGELCRDRPRPLLLGALTLLIGLTHTIGVVYIALCLAFALLLPAVRRRAIVVEWSHHSRIDDHCFLASHIVVSGGVHIGERCFIGVNATFRDHITIGERCLIGAGTLLLGDAAPEGVYSPDATPRARVPSSRLRKI